MRRRDEERPDVSAETVRERADPGSRSRPGPLPPPSGWPAEALAYPFRGAGILSLLVAVAVLTGADVLTSSNAFLGAISKVFLYAWLLAWQVRVAQATALGSDRLPGAWSASDLEPGGISALSTLAIRLAIFLFPAGVTLAIPYFRDPAKGPSADDLRPVFVLAGAAVLLLPTVLLGVVLGDRRLTWPWGAIPWLLRGLATTSWVLLGWGAQAGAEWLVASATGDAGRDRLIAFAATRLGATVLLLSGGRALGVLARRYG